MATTNYRQTISSIADRHAEPGDDWDTNLLAGAPDVIDRDEAIRIAAWLHDEADSEWGADRRHQIIADEIRAAVRPTGSAAQRWIITTGLGLAYHSVHNSLDDALRCVHEQIVQPREHGDVVWQAQVTGEAGYVADGTITLLSWSAPTRTLAGGTRETDQERLRQIVEFVGAPVEHVSICREDRHLGYLRRSGFANADTAERLGAYEQFAGSR